MIFPEGVAVDHEIEVSVDSSVFSLIAMAALAVIAVRVFSRATR